MGNKFISNVGVRVKLRWSISTVLVIVTIFLASLNSLLQNNPLLYKLSGNYHTTLIINALQSKAVSAMAPILATLSFSASYVEDIETKFVRHILVCSGYTGYILSYIVLCYILEGSIFVIGTVLTWQVATVVLLPFEVAALDTISDTITLSKSIWLLCLNGSLWSIVGMTISSLIENRYISYAAPFVIYYLLTIISERYFPDVGLISPAAWIKPDSWPFGILGASIFFLELIILCGIVFIIQSWKRLREL